MRLMEVSRMSFYYKRIKSRATPDFFSAASKDKGEGCSTFQEVLRVTSAAAF